MSEYLIGLTVGSFVGVLATFTSMWLARVTITPKEIG